MTLTCERVPEVIADVFGGEADLGSRAELAEHAAACPACAAHLDRLDVIVDLARGHALSVPAPPPAYWARFGGELRHRIAGDWPPGEWRRDHLALAGSWPEPPWRAPWLARLGPALATAAVVALTLVLAGPPSPKPATGSGGAIATAAAAATPRDLEPSDIHELAVFIDLIGTESLAGETVDLASASAAEALVRPGASGDVFAFFDAAAPLTGEQAAEVLAALELSFPG